MPSTDVIQLTLTLKMTTAQVVEMSVTVNNNSPMFTRTIKLNQLLKWLLGSNLSQMIYVRRNSPDIISKHRWESSDTSQFWLAMSDDQLLLAALWRPAWQSFACDIVLVASFGDKSSQLLWAKGLMCFVSHWCLLKPLYLCALL